MLSLPHGRTGLALALLAGAALAPGCGPSPNPGRPPTAPTPPASTEPAFRLTAGQLTREYAAHRAAADGRDKGKGLAGPGAGGGAGGVISGRSELRLGGVKGGAGLRCEFVPESLPKVRGLSRGQVVTLKGRCAGLAAGGLIDLADCELNEVGPASPLVVAAAVLTRAYAADPK